MIYVLIFIVGGASSQSGYGTVVQEFNNEQACLVAAKSLHDQYLRDKAGSQWLRAWGCFPKGERPIFK